jgi:uridine monophosphate synthetase
MSTSFFEWLSSVARERNSLLCVGLDPRVKDAEMLRIECYRLIDATAEYAAAFKPNSAFFEVFGAEGFAALRDVIAHVPDGTPVILDAKRGDIGDTSEAYARAAFDILGAHAITVNPYLGHDAVAPFLAQPDRGAFVLCKTSNPGADEFQLLDTQDGEVFKVVAEHAKQWNTLGNVGLVVGATDPSALARVRDIAPELWFLVPGVGAQGGELASSLEAGLRSDGLGMLINVSRSLATANDPGMQAKRLRDEINRHRERDNYRSSNERRLCQMLARDLVDSGCIRFGEFTLKSGTISPIYIDLRRLVSHPRILRRVARAYADKLRQLKFDRLVGIPYAALPIATAIGLDMNRPLIYPRREAKEYGTRASIEGDFVAGETALIIDDLATTGGSKIETIEKLAGAGLIVHDVVVLIDRDQGAHESLAAAGYHLHALVTLRELIEELQLAGKITPEQFSLVTAYLESN